MPDRDVDGQVPIESVVRQPNEEGSYKLEDVIRKIRLDIEAIESDEALCEETNFGDRVETLDFLEFRVIERIESLFLADGQSRELTDLRQRTEIVKKQLKDADENLLQRLRENIASGNYTGVELRRQIVEYAGSNLGERNGSSEGYDSLDVLVSGLLLVDIVPEEMKERESEMVFYQPTPARIVLELVEKADFRPEDVFYDIGSGLGQVSILVHLLSGVHAKGVEFEPAYCDYARRCARQLNLSQVEFMNVDAREADYSDGTVFFMYTPCEGKMLKQVLERIRGEARTSGIRLYTYGPCTLQVPRRSWLERVDQNGNQVYKLAIFRSV